MKNSRIFLIVTSILMITMSSVVAKNRDTVYACVDCPVVELTLSKVARMVRDIKKAPVPRDLDLQKVSEFASRVDYMRDRYLNRKGIRDYLSKFKTVIHKSCFKGQTGFERNALIKLFEKSISLVVTRVARCHQTVGFAETSDVIPIIRRAIFKCEKMKSGAGAYLKATSNPRKNIFNFNTAEMKEMVDHYINGDIQNGNSGTYIVKRSDLINKFATRIFHESIHGMFADNASWHNTHLKGHNTQQCKNSTFKDRPYLITAVCNPTSDRGRSFYSNNIANCPKVCKTALTKRMLSMKNIGFSFYILRKGLYRYKTGDAKAICTKIQNGHARMAYLANEFKNNSKRYVDTKAWVENRLGSSDARLKINELFVAIFKDVKRAYLPLTDTPKILKKIIKSELLLKSYVEKRCQNVTRHSKEYSFCNLSPRPPLGLIGIWKSRVESIKASDLKHFYDPLIHNEEELIPEYIDLCY